MWAYLGGAGGIIQPTTVTKVVDDRGLGIGVGKKELGFGNFIYFLKLWTMAGNIVHELQSYVDLDSNSSYATY